MPGNTARSAARQPLGLPKVTAAARATRLSWQNAGKAQKFAPVRGFIWGIPAKTYRQRKKSWCLCITISATMLLTRFLTW
jgi:hypothetical protein